MVYVFLNVVSRFNEVFALVNSKTSELQKEIHDWAYTCLEIEPAIDLIRVVISKSTSSHAESSTSVSVNVGAF